METESEEMLYMLQVQTKKKTWPGVADQPRRLRTLATPWWSSSPAVLTLSPVFSSSLPLLVEDGVSSPSRDTRTKSSLLRVDTESEDTLIFPTEPLSSMAAAVKLSHAAHEWETGGGGGGSGGRWWAKPPGKGKRNKERKEAKRVMTNDEDPWNREIKKPFECHRPCEAQYDYKYCYSTARPTTHYSVKSENIQSSV